MPEGLSSTAIFCSSLKRLVSLSHSTEPAPPLRIWSSALGPGAKSAPPTWLSCPIFSSRLIRLRNALTLLATSFFDGTDAAVPAFLLLFMRSPSVQIGNLFVLLPGKGWNHFAVLI